MVTTNPDVRVLISRATKDLDRLLKSLIAQGTKALGGIGALCAKDLIIIRAMREARGCLS